MPATIRLRDVQLVYEEHCYRTPIKFGGVALDRATILNVKVTVEDQAGRRGWGYGSMPLGNVWAYPSKQMQYEETLSAMRQVAERCALFACANATFAHPLEMNHDWYLEFLRLAGEVSRTLPEPLPKLAVLVANSPLDAAVHDAYGRLLNLNSYQALSRSFLPQDVGSFLGNAFANVWLEEHLCSEPRFQMPMYHLVGALDPLTAEDVTSPVCDGLPEHLQQWIERDRLTHLKIKLNGDDLDWDVERVVAVDRVASLCRGRDGDWERHTERDLRYSLDFNEKCRDVEYLLEFIGRMQEVAPGAWQRVQYIEQPTARDLRAHPENKMHAISQIVPVVIDESLTDVETLMLARDQGYTGVALKACKGISGSVLLAAAARHLGLFLCVQDLTCPGASLVLSAGLAAHVRGVAAIEANARQYLPAANERWKLRYPHLFEPLNGMLDTGQLDGIGLSLAADLMPWDKQ